MPWETIFPHVLGILFSIALIVFALVITVSIVKSQKASGGVTNNNAQWTEHLFFVPCKKEAFLRQLYLPSENDVMECTFDESSMSVVLAKWADSATFDVFIRECEGGCYVRLRRQRRVLSKSAVQYFVNEFMIKKFDAKPLPYEQYRDTCV